MEDTIYKGNVACKRELSEILEKKENWNKEVVVDEKTFLYSSTENKLYRLFKKNGETSATQLVGIFADHQLLLWG